VRATELAAEGVDEMMEVATINCVSHQIYQIKIISARPDVCQRKQ
jgi:hypothetical protein|tara:strand:- start:3216 stop:3350 length:135 start_codon:yes stop_codon:yes gene_type:complete